MFKTLSNNALHRLRLKDRMRGLGALARSSLRSVRTRLVILALIVLVPFMMDRVRVLEQFRDQSIAEIREDAMGLARQSAQRQAEVIANTEALLQSTARLYEQIVRNGGGCAELSAAAASAPWTKGLSVINERGQFICTSEPRTLGINIADRPYFQTALQTGGFAVSDYIVARATQKPIIAAVHGAKTRGERTDSVVMMVVNLQWLANLKTVIESTRFASILVVDRNGMLVTGSDDIRDRIGDSFEDHALVKTMVKAREGSVTLEDFAGVRRIFAFSEIPGAATYLAVGISERNALAEINRAITWAYIQLVIFVLAAMIGAWFASEIMIMRPIRAFAKTAARLGKGDLTARVSPNSLAIEFKPLASAFNEMATQLAGRQHGLVADNNRLVVLASLDSVSGLGNRRGFDSRIEFEWMRMASEDRPLGLLMIDLDHFKQFNDAYGHPEGDACLRAIGAVLGEIADGEAGFAARYGGEEFVLLVPDADLNRIAAIGERLRRRIFEIDTPHCDSPFARVTVSVGASATVPDPATPPNLLVEAADAGLYAAKRRGRNQVVAHDVIAPLADPGPARDGAPPVPQAPPTSEEAV